MDHVEFLLKRPDTHIGPTQPAEQSLIVFAPAADGLSAQVKTMTLSPALRRLAGELTANAVDNSRRDDSQRFIKIAVDRATGAFEVCNDGCTLPVKPFQGDKDRLVPTVAFSEFMSSTNYDDEKERLGCGKNGVGAKGCNVYAAAFEVTIQTGEKHFYQKWERNMSATAGPKVTSKRAKTRRTTVRWTPDYARLGMPHVAESGLSDDEYDALCALAYQTSVCSPPSVAVHLNDHRLAARSTEHIVRALGGMAPIATDTVDGEMRLNGPSGQDLRLSVSVGARTPGRPGMFVAFVNGTECPEGTHAKWVLSKITDVVLAKARKRKHGEEGVGELRPSALHTEMVVACTLVINQPRFDSQQKTKLSSAVKEFGLSWTPSEKFGNAIARGELPARAAELGRSAVDRQLEKATKATRAKVSVPKYQPAERLRNRASLILTEGDSALNFAVAGLGVIGRKDYGVFPLRGKLLNARNASVKKLMENAEINALVKILGFELNRTYTADDVKGWNYAQILILTDQDPDGMHALAPTLDVPCQPTPCCDRLGLTSLRFAPLPGQGRTSAA